MLLFPFGLLSLFFMSAVVNNHENTLSLAIDLEDWPGMDDIQTVDTNDYFTEKLSGLFYQPQDGANAAILWGIQNYPPIMYKLTWDGNDWVSSPSNGWENGKTISYVNGEGFPDAEDLTMAHWDSNMIFVCSERNGHDSESRLSVLLYMDTDVDTFINATMEWVLTSDFPTVDANEGFEAITWVPDEFLVLGGFVDQHLDCLYDPLNYPDHSGGLIFLGLESGGGIYAYVLSLSSGTYQRVASFPSGSDYIMSLSFDRDSGYLWSMCDDTCNGIHNVHMLDNSTGKFTQIASYSRPSSMGGNYDTEGFTIASESQCDANNQRRVFWADDKNDANHSLRTDTIPCGQFIENSLLDDDNIHSGSSWTDEQVSLVMMGVIFGAFFLLAVAVLVYRHKHPPSLKRPTRRPQPTAKKSSDETPSAHGADMGLGAGTGAGTSGGARVSSARLTFTSNPLAASRMTEVGNTNDYDDQL